MTSPISPRSKLFAHLDRLRLIQQGKKPAPVNVEIDLSNRCDLKCAGCHFSYTHTRGPWAGNADKPEGFIPGGDLMDFDLAIDMLDQLAAFRGDGDTKILSITWTGGGESTLHPRFDDIIKHAHSVGLEQGIYSHGGFIRDERAKWMKQHFKWIYFSFDAHDVESYKEYKGVNRFDRVCTNIKQLLLMDGKATVGMGFLVHKDNWKHIYDMVYLGRDLGVDYVQFRPLILADQHAPGKLNEDDTAWINRAIGKLNSYKHDPFVIADTSRFLRYATWQGHGYPICYWSALQTVITPNGKIWRCTNKREHPDGLLGDLATERFEAIWQRSGGACAVNGQCRIACKGDLGNQTLEGVMAPQTHANFV